MVGFTKDQCYIVTGASSGIGRSVALKLNELGATVVAVARDVARLQETKALSNHQDCFHVMVRDLVVDPDGLVGFVREVRTRYGKLSGLAYCAGFVPIMPVRAIDAESMRAAFAVNYLAPVLMAKAVVDKRNNVGAGTACAFVASVAATRSDKGHVIYAGTKAALIASVRSIAKEVASAGIRLNCVSPSNIRVEKTNEEYVASQIEKYPMGFGEVTDVANVVALLLSSDTKWVTAQNYVVDCGSF